MPFDIDGRTVYRIGEALTAVGVSRATYFRWVRDGRITDTEFRDRNGRRVLTSEEVEHLKRFAHKLIESPQLRIPLVKA